MITIPVIDDLIVEGTESVSITLGSVTSGDAQISINSAQNSSSINIVDNDVAGVLVTEYTGTPVGNFRAVTTEASGTTSFSFALTSMPTGSVVLGLASSDLTEGTIATSSLTFTPSNWNVPQQVTITGVDDAIDDGDVVYRIITSPIVSTDSFYNGLNSGDVPALNLDNDNPVLTLTIDNNSLAENGSVRTGTVTRNTGSNMPAFNQPLVVNLASSDSSEVSVPATVTILAGQSSATFLVTPVDDNVIDGTKSANITASQAGFVSGVVGVTVADDEGPLRVALSLDSANLGENGGVVTATVTLSDLLESDKTYFVSQSPFGMSSRVSTVSSVTIPAGSLSGTFALTGLNNSILDGNLAGSVSISDSPVAAAASASFTVIDDEVFGLSLAIAPISISEFGGSATGTVTLDFAQTSDLTIALSSSDTTEATLGASSITIAAGSSTGTFLVSGVDDLYADGSRPVTISAVANSLTATNSITVTDNESALSLSLSPNSINVSETGSATVTVTLNHPLEADSTFPVALSGPGLVGRATLPANVTVAADSTSATFVITGVDNIVDEGDASSLLIVGNAGDLSAGTATVTVVDDDVAVLSLALADSSISEAGGSTTGTLRLSTPYFQDVIVSLSSSDTSEATVPSSVTIIAGQTSATFTVSAVDDALDDDGKTSSITATSILGNAAGSVTVVDNESAALSIAIGAAAISENAGTTPGVVSIDFALEADLIVSLTSNDTTEATVPATVTIIAGQLSASFTISGVDEIVDDGDQLVSIQAGSSKGSATGQLTVQDDDTAVLSLSLASSTVAENGGTTLATVSISNPLPSDLVVSLASSDTSELIVPAQVTIVAGQTVATFEVSAVDDNVVDGNVAATINATSAIGNATSSVIVQDNDVLQFAISLANASISENGGATTGQITLVSQLLSDLTVSLTSSDSTEASVTPTIVIPAGQLSASFNVSAVNDNAIDGTQVVVITASGGTTATTSLSVTDDDVLVNTPPQIVAISAPVLSGNAVSGSAITLTGSYTDPDVSDTHTVTVNWGDGSTQVLAANQVNQNANTFAVNHVYATGGIFTVTVNVSDGLAQDVESTTSVVTGTGVVDGTLYVIGTDQKDKIDIKRLGGSNGSLNVNAKLNQGSNQILLNQNFAPATVNKIVVIARDGDDNVDIHQSVSINATILGGNGEDDLRGGSGNDVIVGGGGEDDLRGNDGDDILIGGDGEDELEGDSGSDLLIGTAWNMDSNLTALDAIHSEWNSGSTYEQKLDHLRGLVSGGLNGSFLLDAASLNDDNDADKLEGDSGRDAFFAKLSGSKKDSVKDKQSNESVVLLF